MFSIELGQREELNTTRHSIMRTKLSAISTRYLPAAFFALQ
jgi:hypothetical protein